MTPVESSDGNFYGSTLVLANVDHDSPTLQYQGKHEELFSDPQILAVLAAAPFYTGINSNNSQTSISFGSGTGVDQQSTIGLRTSTSIGYMSPDFFGEASFSWSLTFGYAMDAIPMRRSRSTRPRPGPPAPRTPSSSRRSPLTSTTTRS